MDMNDRESPQRSSPARQQLVKDQQINELSEMVKELLREQQELKEQLANSKIGGKIKPPISFQKKPMQTLNKKSSERVPRGSGMVDRDQYIKGQASRDRDSENPRAFLNLPLQVKPGEGNPKQNIK